MVVVVVVVVVSDGECLLVDGDWVGGWRMREAAVCGEAVCSERLTMWFGYEMDETDKTSCQCCRCMDG